MARKAETAGRQQPAGALRGLHVVVHARQLVIQQLVDTRASAEALAEEHVDSTVRRLLLDHYDVTYGILTPDEAAAFSIIPNAILGARLASAYNEWLVERWLSEDSRLRALVVIAAQHPEEAAAETGGR